jgi:hypothetical protein
MWIELSEFDEEVMYRGARIRVAVTPNHGEDKHVDFMIFHDFYGPSDGFSLLRISGYKAGHLAATLPSESTPEKAHGILVKWLRKNWKKWMPVDGKPERIWINISKPRVRLRS